MSGSKSQPLCYTSSNILYISSSVLVTFYDLEQREGVGDLLEPKSDGLVCKSPAAG